jgi:hypothetical protein
VPAFRPRARKGSRGRAHRGLTGGI